MIEEMMESASMVNGEDTDHAKAAKDKGLVCLTFYDFFQLFVLI